MRHLIAVITETVTTNVNTALRGIVVKDRATRGVCMADYARSLLLRLSGRMPACLQAVAMCHVRAARAGAARLTGPDCPGRPWLRPSCRRVKPRAGASRMRF